MEIASEMSCRHSSYRPSLNKAADRLARVSDKICWSSSEREGSSFVSPGLKDAGPGQEKERITFKGTPGYRINGIS